MTGVAGWPVRLVEAIERKKPEISEPHPIVPASDPVVDIVEENQPTTSGHLDQHVVTSNAIVDSPPVTEIVDTPPPLVPRGQPHRNSIQNMNREDTHGGHHPSPTLSHKPDSAPPQPSKTTWEISACDAKAFSALDNNLTKPEEIPECVRNKTYNRSKPV